LTLRLQSCRCIAFRESPRSFSARMRPRLIRVRSIPFQFYPRNARNAAAGPRLSTRIPAALPTSTRVDRARRVIYPSRNTVDEIERRSSHVTLGACVRARAAAPALQARMPCVRRLHGPRPRTHPHARGTLPHHPSRASVRVPKRGARFSAIAQR